MIDSKLLMAEKRQRCEWGGIGGGVEGGLGRGMRGCTTGGGGVRSTGRVK